MIRFGWLAALLPAVLLAPPALSADGDAGGKSGASAPSATPSAHAQHRHDEQREAALRRLREQGLQIPSALPALSALPSSSSSPPPLASARPLAQELWQKWRAFAASRTERRAEHRAALMRDLGTRLSDPAVKSELRLHATRVAELARIRFLAENARTGAEREKLLARVDRLAELEARQHRQRLGAISQPATAPGGSAGPRSPALRSSAGPAGSAAR